MEFSYEKIKKKIKLMKSYFSSETKEPKLRKLGVFWANYFNIVKSTQFGQNWVLFFRKWYTDGSVWNWAKKKKVQRKSDFRGPAGTSTYYFGESNLPGAKPLVIFEKVLSLSSLPSEGFTSFGLSICIPTNYNKTLIQPPYQMSLLLLRTVACVVLVTLLYESDL